MRKLPVYLLLDTSGSMFGEPIESVNNGLKTMVAALKQNPHALETAYLSVITFDSSAKQTMPMTEVATFVAPNLSASGCTALGEALELVRKCAERDVTPTTTEVKGDWKPLVFIMTDGEPTDDFEKGLAEFKKGKWGTVVCCAAGQHANKERLAKISEIIVSLDTTDSKTIEAFFKWVTASIQTASKKVEDNYGDLKGIGELPPPPSEVVVVV